MKIKSCSINSCLQPKVILLCKDSQTLTWNSWSQIHSYFRIFRCQGVSTVHITTYFVTSPVATPCSQRHYYHYMNVYIGWMKIITGLQVNSGRVFSLTEFSPNLHTSGFQSFGNFRIVAQTLWTLVALCSCFFLMLLLDVVQSTFKKIMFLWVRQSGCPYHLSSLSCRKSMFLSCSTVAEKIRGKFIFGLPSGCLSGCWLNPSQWSQRSSQLPSL